MTNFRYISPVLPVSDIRKEIEFFESLGFKNVYDSLRYADQLDYAVMGREDQAIHLQKFDAFDGQQVKIWVSELDEIAHELDANNIAYNCRENTPWETSEIGLYSPARHAVFFVKDLAGD